MNIPNGHKVEETRSQVVTTLSGRLNLVDNSLRRINGASDNRFTERGREIDTHYRRSILLWLHTRSADGYQSCSRDDTDFECGWKR